MDAPIAQLDEEWENFSSFSTGQFEQKEALPSVGRNKELGEKENLDNFPKLEDNVYKSMEDLVHSFEETLSSCFRVDCTKLTSENEKVTALDDNMLLNNSLWKRISDNYGLVQPLNWKTSQIRKLHIPALELAFKAMPQGKNVLDKDLEDPELEEQLDLHKMVEYNVYNERNDPIFFTHSADTDETVMQTADEVIEELEQIMMKADDADVAADLEVQEQTGIIISETYSENEEVPVDIGLHRRSVGSPSSEEESGRATELKNSSISELNSICEQLDSEVKTLSSELLQQLNYRDELQFENEVRNSLISNVLEVQYKQEQFRKSNKLNIAQTTAKFGRLKRSATAESVSSTDGHYLTTAIPCNRGDLSIGNLQALNRLLNAIKADSEEVPSMLTSYILTVLCPAPVPSNQHGLKW